MQGSKILIIEEDMMLRKAIRFKLKKDGYHVYAAEDGKQGLNLIREVRPILVITDLLLPYIQGLELISIVKKDPELFFTRFIVLSTDGFEDNVQEAFNLGASDFILKPFNFNELAIRVRKVLRREFQSIQMS